MGCIMGSKMLKAIAVKGTKGLKVNDPAKLLEVYSNHYRQITSTSLYPVISRYGTLTIFCVQNQSGMISVKNNQYNHFEEAEGRLEASKRDAEAKVVLAEASQQAIEKVTEAIGSNEMPVMYLIGEKYVESLKHLSTSDNAKIVMMPAEIPSAIRGLLSGIKK